MSEADDLVRIADVLVRKVNEWVDLQKKCSRKLENLADELEEAVKAANVTKVVGSSVSVGGAAAMTTAGVLTLLTGGAALPVMATVGAVGAVASWTSAVTSVGSDAYSASKSKDIMEEAQKVLEELQDLEQEMKNLIKSLKRQASGFHHRGGSAAGGDDDDDDDDGNVMEFFMRSMARREGLHLPGIMIRAAIGLPLIKLFRMLTGNSNVITAYLKILSRALFVAAKEGGKKAASSLGKKAASKAVGNMAGGAVGLVFSVPELLSDCQNLDNIETEASQTLRENARTVQSNAEETEQELQKIREALKKLMRIKFIIQKEKMTRDEKRELIDHIINNTPSPELKQWLKENAESDILVHLVNLAKFIAEELEKEAKKKEEEDRKKKMIELVFLAHGSIVDWMIPAGFLMPLPSIKDVLLYSPWNCLLSAEAAYSIAIGSIQPNHRQFGCANPHLCPFPPAAHTSFHLPQRWNSMRNAGLNNVPVIMVGPVGKEGDPAFAAFTALAAQFGAPAANRYLVPFLDLGIGEVPFFTITLAISLVLFFSGYEAIVHLAACLGKSPENAVMQEAYLSQQYAYTVNNTGMTVPRETIHYINGPVFNMFKAVFGDESPFF